MKLTQAEIRALTDLAGAPVLLGIMTDSFFEIVRRLHEKGLVTFTTRDAMATAKGAQLIAELEGQG